MRGIWIIPVVILVVAVTWWQVRPDTVHEIPLHTISIGSVERIAANSRAGTVYACSSSELSLDIGGRVAKLYVSEGDQVKAQQLLLELHNDEEQARLALANAELRASKIDEQRTCGVAALAQREADRAQSLVKQKMVSSERLDQLKTEAQSTALMCRHSRALTERSVAARDLTQIQLENTRLSAPFAGTIAAVNGEVGEIVTPSPPGIQTPPAIELLDDSCLYIEAPIDEVEASRVAVGQPTRVTLDAFRGVNFDAVVARTGTRVSALEKQARTLNIEVMLVDPPPEIKLLVGYSADVEIITGAANAVLRVPTEALLGGNQLVRYNPSSSRLERINVDVGLTNWTWSEVRAGVSEGDQILTRLNNIEVLLADKVRPEAVND